MQYTLRNIPKDVDAALRRRASAEGKTLNEAAVDALAEGLGLTRESKRRRSVRDLVGSVPCDPELEAAIADQRRIDEELWR